MEYNIIVYLGGPIRSLSYNEAIKWRISADKYFNDVGIKCLSPMRGKEYLKGVDKITDSYKDLKGYSSSEIFERDKFDIKRSNILLFNFLNRKGSIIGSFFELAWGHLLGKYCIVVVENDSVYAKHPFVKESASIMFDNLDEAIYYVGKIYGKKS